jgi:hypothetical protein
MTAVWRYSQAPTIGGLLILIAMADWCDDDGYCYPSHRAIALKTGASVATVKRTLREHIGRGEVEQVAVKGHDVPSPREFVGRTGFQPTNLYRVTLVDKLGSPRPQLLARNRVTMTPLSKSKGGHPDPERVVTASPKEGSLASGSLLSDTSEDPSEDPSEGSPDRAGAPRRSPADDESPEENIGVITRIVHEVLDLYAAADDVTEADVIETVKRHCAQLGIAYQSDVVWRAFESAVVQRRRIGKPSLLAGSR